MTASKSAASRGGQVPPTAFAARVGFRSPRRPRTSRIGDIFFRFLCQAAATLVILLAALLLTVLITKAWLAIETIGIRFFTTKVWDPQQDHQQFGSLAFIYGTLVTSAIAMLLAVPLGIGTAVFLSEIAPGWLKRVGSFLVEMLAAVPSVVYGFWGLFVLGPGLQGLVSTLGGPNFGGVGILPASIVLSIMVVPYVASVSFDVCRAVPRSQREAALALGATRWQMIWSVVLPYARPGIVGGCFLALGRALGETMAVTMLIGYSTEITFSPFAKGNSIASAIANEFADATYDLYLSALVELALVLLLVSIIVNSLARLLIWRVGKVGTTGSPRPSAAKRRMEPAPARSRSRARPRSERARWVNRVMTGVLALCLVTTVVPLFSIFGYIVYRGMNALNWSFFVHLPAPVGEKGGGMANAIYGSVMLLGLASLFAVPVGVLSAIYLAEYRSGRLGAATRFINELLGGVPSIVIGIFGYILLVKPLGHFSGWAGAFALGIIMIPIVMRASEEALKLVPQTLRQASHALGAAHWQTVIRVTVPAALPTIVTGVFLAIARIGGETAPLLLTALSNPYWPTSPNDCVPSLPVYLFNYAMSPSEEWHRQAWAAALVLLLGVTLLNFGVRSLTGKRIVLASRAE